MTAHQPFATRTAVLIGSAVAAVAALVGIGATMAAPAGAQQAATGRSCAPGEGVTVVVDFDGLGGIRVGCAVGAQSSGFAALAAAGFGADNGGQAGIVCQIDGQPAQGYPYCWTEGGYWAYWKKARGGSWSYSGVGAAGGAVGVDMVEGWSWAADFDNQPPRADENSVPSSTSTTSTSSTSSTTSTTRPGATTSTTPTPSSTEPPVSTSTPGSTSLPGTTATSPTTPTTAPTSSVPGGSGASGSGGASGSSAAQPTSTALARTGSDPSRFVAVGLLLLLAGASAVATGRRLALRAR